MLRSLLLVATVAGGAGAWRAYVTAPVPVWSGPAIIGALRAGGVVTVASTDGGWAELAGGGSVPRNALVPGEVAAPPPVLRWGAVGESGARVRAAPRSDAGVLLELEAPYSVAMFDDEALLRRGWLQRTQGGYVD